jgi:hypothetical protein
MTVDFDINKISPAEFSAGLKIIYGQNCDSATGRFSVLLGTR